MSEETRINSEQTATKMDRHTLLGKLKHYFHHQSFKSDLQQNAIITILTRKCIIIIRYLLLGKLISISYEAIIFISYYTEII